MGQENEDEDDDDDNEQQAEILKKLNIKDVMDAISLIEDYSCLLHLDYLSRKSNVKSNIILALVAKNVVWITYSNVSSFAFEFLIYIAL